MKFHHEELQWLLGVLTGIGTAVVPPRQTGNPLPAARYPLKKKKTSFQNRVVLLCIANSSTFSYMRKASQFWRKQIQFKTKSSSTMLDASVSNVQCYYLEKGLQIFQQSVSHLKILGAYLGDVKQVPY